MTSTAPTSRPRPTSSTRRSSTAEKSTAQKDAVAISGLTITTRPRKNASYIAT